MIRFRVFSLILTIVWLAACSGDTGAAFTEIGRTNAAGLDLVVLSDDDAIRHGKDAFVLEFRRGDGTPVDVGTVKLNATMPMAGMAPMFGSAEVSRDAVAGRYRVTADFSMAGTWRLNAEWSGTAGAGSASWSIAVR